MERICGPGNELQLELIDIQFLVIELMPYYTSLRFEDEDEDEDER